MGTKACKTDIGAIYHIIVIRSGPGSRDCSCHNT